MTNFSSPLVCCIICKTVKSSKGIHSHFIKAHTAEGNAKAKITGSLGGASTRQVNLDAKTEIETNYNQNPCSCASCFGSLPFKSRNNKFCSKHCSAVFNGAVRQSTGWKQSDHQKLCASLSMKARPAKPPYSKISYCTFCTRPFEGIRKTCSDECMSSVLSRTAKLNPMLGGNKNNRAYGWYESPTAGRVWLESSYEYKVALDLDTNQVRWSRPKGLKYTLDGKARTYLPDFYLIDYNVFLDPKNDFLIQQDAQKIEQVQLQNNVTVIVLDKNNLTWLCIVAALPN